MPQKSSREVVLEFMAEHPIPLGPKQIYGGLIATGTINFGYRTVQNRVRDLSADGYLKRVKIDTEEGRIYDAPSTDADTRAYYLITDEGIEAVTGE